MSSPKKNVAYNIIYQVLILIIPLITAPYLSRAVGVDGVGIYSYTHSIVSYFMLLTLLGLNNYGNRSIAKVRDNKYTLSKTFFGIYATQIFMGFVMLIAYFLYIYIFNVEFKNIAIIQSLFILSSIFDINWLFFGLEQFKVTITRNTIIKILSLVLIFALVKTPNDLWKYVLIMSSTTLLSQLSIWVFLKGKISFVRITFKDIIKHIRPNLILFIPVIAISLYRIMDKIMLGLLANVSEVGYYENAEKIVQIPTTIITALGTVMLPRISNMMSKGKIEETKKYMLKSISFVLFLSLAMMFGLMAIAKDFAPFYFGSDFKKTGILIIFLSITLPFISFANVIRTQYLIPRERDKIYICSVLLGAISNLILNSILIPLYNSIGACIGTIFSEIVVMLFQTVLIKKDLEIKEYFKLFCIFFIKSLIMYVIIYCMNFIEISNYIKIPFQVLTGCILYFILNINYIMSIINLKSIFKRKKEKIK